MQLFLLIVIGHLSCAPDDTFTWEPSSETYSDTSLVDQALFMMCPAYSVMTSIESVFEEMHGDRRYTVRCHGVKPPFTVSPSDFYNTVDRPEYYDPNTMHGYTPYGLQSPYQIMSPTDSNSPWTRICDQGYVVTGMLSQHINWANAREWDFRCSRIVPDVYAETLTNGDLSEYTLPVDMTVVSPSVMLGFRTERRFEVPNVKDRRWSLLSGVLCATSPIVHPTWAPWTLTPVSPVPATIAPTIAPTKQTAAPEVTVTDEPTQSPTESPSGVTGSPKTDLPASGQQTLSPRVPIPPPPSLVTLKEGDSVTTTPVGNLLFLYDKTRGWHDDITSHYDRVPTYMTGASLWMLPKQMSPNEQITITCTSTDQADTSSVCDTFIIMTIGNRNNVDQFISKGWIVSQCAPIVVDEMGFPNQMLVLRKFVRYSEVELVDMSGLNTPYTGVAVHVFAKDCDSASKDDCETGSDYCRWSSQACFFGDSCSGSLYRVTPQPSSVSSPLSELFASTTTTSSSSSDTTTSTLLPVIVGIVALCGCGICIVFLFKAISSESKKEPTKVLGVPQATAEPEPV